MAKFLLQAGEKIVVHERHLICELEVARAGSGDYMIYLQIPHREPDGSYCGSDCVRSFEMQLEETSVFPFKGWPGIPDGEVHVTIESDDGRVRQVEVTTPPKWRAVDANTFSNDSYRGR